MSALVNESDVLCRFFVSREIWALLDTDPAAFKRRVKDYVALCMPHYEVVKASPKERIIWLRRKRNE